MQWPVTQQWAVQSLLEGLRIMSMTTTHSAWHSLIASREPKRIHIQQKRDDKKVTVIKKNWNECTKHLRTAHWEMHSRARHWATARAVTRAKHCRITVNSMARAGCRSTPTSQHPSLTAKICNKAKQTKTPLSEQRQKGLSQLQNQDNRRTNSLLTAELVWYVPEPSLLVQWPQLEWQSYGGWNLDFNRLLLFFRKVTCRFSAGYPS